jgi:4'-phosphopantetheinyl transferase
VIVGGVSLAWARAQPGDDLSLAARDLLRRSVHTDTGAPLAALRLERMPCRRCGEPHGRPRLAPIEGVQLPDVSVAHTVGAVVVAHGPHLVGVDVEQAGAARFEGFDDVALGADERAALQLVPTARRAMWRTRAWVRKEAVLKATGHGLSVDPRDVVVADAPQGPVVRSWSGPDAVSPRRIQLHDVHLADDLVVALATVR